MKDAIDRAIGVVDDTSVVIACSELGRIGEVIDNDLGHFGEMPTIPFLNTHSISIKFLIEIIQKSNGLNNHGINLIRGEFELIT